MNEKLKVVRAYTEHLDIPFITFEIEGTTEYKDLSENETYKLMKTDKFNSLCKQYFLDNLIDYTSLFFDYWFDGLGWESQYKIGYEKVFNMVHGNTEDKQEFINLVREDLNSIIDFMFSEEGIDEGPSWYIAFI